MTECRVMGIDEAGRGPVIGPMIICGVVASESLIPALIRLGVKDSKELSPSKRMKLRNEIIKSVLGFAMKEVSPHEIDNAVFRGKLNLLEAEKMAEIITRLKPEVVYVDAPMVDTDKFANLIKNLVKIDLKVIAENDADKKFPIVGAASILAKTKRDEIIERLHEKYGDFGSGYPSDEKTVNFLKKWYLKNRNFPSIVRRSWETIRELKAELTQTKIADFY